MAVTFFMYLMFWVPHPKQPVPIFEDIAAAFTLGSGSLKGAIIVAMIGIAVFAVINIRSLVWNFATLRAFSKTPEYRTFRASNAETTLLAASLVSSQSLG